LLTHAHQRLLDVEPVGGVTVVRIHSARVWDEEEVSLLRGRLCRLVEQAGCRDLVVDLRPVDSLVSSMTSLLIALHKRTRATGGRLALCGLSPWVARLLETLRLDHYFAVYPGVEEALQSFGTSVAGAALS
jgi:anti-sigma B factor antagonist